MQLVAMTTHALRDTIILYKGILVYSIYLISISNPVSDGATNKSVLNQYSESHRTINSANKYEPDVLNTFLRNTGLKTRNFMNVWAH